MNALRYLHRAPVVAATCALLLAAAPTHAQVLTQPPPGVQLPPSTAPDEGHARQSLDQALEHLRGLDTSRASEEAPPPPQAVRLYVEGRQHLLNGDANEAARAFLTASNIDPGAPAPAEALGEMLLQRGLIAQGMAAYRQAVDAGSTTPTVLLDVAQSESRAGQNQAAAILLVRAFDSLTARPAANPLVRTIVTAQLSEQLLNIGFLNAALEAGDQAIERIQRLSPDAPNVAERRLRASLGEFHRLLGDAAVHLNEPARALEHYQRARDAQLPWQDIAPRLAWLLSETGQQQAALDAALPEDEPQRIASAHTTDLLIWLIDHGIDRSAVARRIETAAQTFTDPPPSLQSRLDLARAIARPPAEAFTNHLRPALERSPHLPEMHRAVVRSPEFNRSMAAIMREHPLAARGLARAWLAAQPSDLRALADQPIGVIDPHAMAAIWLEVGRPERAAQHLEDQPPSLLKAQTLGLNTQWDEFERTIAALTSPLDQAEACIDASLLDRASVYIEQAPPSPRRERLGARVRALQGQTAEALTAYERMLETDTFDTHALRAIVSLVGRAGPAPDPARFEPAFAALAATEPRDPLVLQLKVQRTAEQQGAPAAVEQSIGLLSAGPAVASVLVELAPAVDEQSRERIIEALERAHDERPHDTSILVPLIALSLQLGDLDRAESLVNAYTGPSLRIDDLASVIEARRVPQSARRKTAERLRNGPQTIYRTLRLAETLLVDEPDEARALLRRVLRPGLTLTGQNEAALNQTLLSAGQLAEQQASAERAQTTLSMIAEAEAMGFDPAWQVRLVGFSCTLIALDQAPSDEPEQASERIASAVRALVEAIDNRETAQALARRYRGERANIGQTINQARAEVAYSLAGALHFEGRTRAARRVYRLALELDPFNIWANNDLGYFLTLDGRLDEAEPLVERAFQLAPEEINILDSIAWLRFKQGRLEDDATGRGAISLFEEALRRDDGKTNDTVQQQAGDVFWTAGDRERALQAWTEAARLLEDQLAEVDPGTRLHDRWSEDLAQVRRRLDRASDDLDPLADVD